MKMNYKLLLKKYMQYVGSLEGTDYTDTLNPEAKWPNGSDNTITKEEAIELIKLSNEQN
jgi:hypothetical protein